MGVYIDMEMPTKGYRLILVHANGTVQTTDGETTAVPVPEPHGALIDMNDFLDEWDELESYRTAMKLCEVIPASEEGE